uniref:Uncharacterized protein n=1 Tax=Oreochromis aureus TaxID=47969 RepID=A0AAZ1XCZ6_OREAU
IHDPVNLKIQHFVAAMKAAVLIQRWYTWNIFQSIEYAGNKTNLISQLLDPVVDPWLDRETCYNLIHVPESYTGPRLSFPLSVADTNALLSAFKDQQVPNMSLSLCLLNI